MTTPCPNWRLCGKIDTYGGTYCGSCFWMFNNTFEFTYDTIECPMCYEETCDNIILPCNHTFCIMCFKRFLYGRDDIPEPEYPYPDEHEEYETDPKLIEYNKRFDEFEEANKPHESSGGCPCCRVSLRTGKLYDRDEPSVVTS